MNGVDQADLNKLGQRVDRFAKLIAHNADQFASLQQELARAKATGPTNAPTAVNLDDLMARLAALEAAGVDQISAPTVTDEQPVQGGFDTTQIGLLVATGCLPKIWLVAI